MKRDHGPHGLGDLSPMLIKVRSITGYPTRRAGVSTIRSRRISDVSSEHRLRNPRAPLPPPGESTRSPETAPRLPPKGKQLFGCACEQASELGAPLRNRSVDLLLTMDRRWVAPPQVENLNG